MAYQTRSSRTELVKTRANWLRTLFLMLALLGPWMSGEMHASVATGVIVPVPSTSGTILPYMLYLPSSYNPNSAKVWPLIICLDGLGQDGDGSSDGTLNASSTNQLAYVLQLGPLEFINSGSTYFNNNAIIIQPQSTNGSWNSTYLNNTINQVAGATQGTGLYNVDLTRMYLLGFSAGGGGAWTYGMTYASRMAVMVVMAGAVEASNSVPFTIYDHTIVWGIHDDQDPTVRPPWTTGCLTGVAPTNFGGWMGNIAASYPGATHSTRCLDNHPDKPTIGLGGVGNAEPVYLNGITATRSGYYNTTTGWTWVDGQVAVPASMLMVTIIKSNQHDGWDQTFGTGSSPNLWFWNWMLGQQYGVLPTVGTSPYVQVTPTTSSVAGGATLQLSAVAYNANGTPVVPQPTFTWTTNGNTNGSISSSGLYTALAGSGFVTVSAQASISATSYSGSVPVTMTAPTTSLADVALSPSPTLILSIGQTQQFTAIAQSSGAVALSPQPTITWSAAGSAGTISATGLFTAQSVGNVTVSASATVLGVTQVSSTVVTVQAPLVDIALTPTPTAAIMMGQTQQFTAVAQTTGGVALSPQPTITWSQSGAAGTVSASGLFTPTATGSATVTATATVLGVTKSASTVVTVSPQFVAVAITPTATLALSVPQTQQFTAIAQTSGGVALSPQPTITWSEVGAAGTVSANGLFTAHAPGSATVTATATVLGVTLSSFTVVTVSPQFVALALTPSPTVSLSLVQTQQFSAIAQTTAQVALSPQPTITWSATGSAGHVSNSGLFTPVASGTATVTASATILGVTQTSSSVVTVVPTPAVAPVFAVPSSSFTGSQLVTISSTTAAALIYYTTDGTTPTAASSLYSVPFTITSSTVISAIAIAPAFENSAVTTVIYSATPTVLVPAAGPGTVSGTTASLSVQGAQTGLYYSWSVIGTPPASVAISPNGTAGAGNTTATFISAGSYQFQVAITDEISGLSVTSGPITVVVAQTFTSLTLAPATYSAVESTVTPFVATALDQFANPMSAPATIQWLVSGGGTVDANGNFTAGTTPTTSPVTLTASCQTLTAHAQISVVAAALPTVTIAASSGSIAENSVSGDVVTLTRSSTTGTLSVNLTWAGTAVAGTDYIAGPGSVSFTAGQATQTFTLMPHDNGIHGRTPVVIVGIAAGVGYNAGSPANASVTITDVDPLAAASSTFQLAPTQPFSDVSTAFTFPTNEANPSILSATWVWGDNATSTSTGPTASHIYVTAGTYTVQATLVEPGTNATVVLTEQVTVDAAPTSAGAAAAAAPGGGGGGGGCGLGTGVAFVLTGLSLLGVRLRSARHV